jgi:hypothetical protein
LLPWLSNEKSKNCSGKFRSVSHFLSFLNVSISVATGFVMYAPLLQREMLEAKKHFVLSNRFTGTVRAWGLNGWYYEAYFKDFDPNIR